MDIQVYRTHQYFKIIAQNVDIHLYINIWKHFMVHTMGCFFVNIYDFSHHYFEVEIADFSNDHMYNFKLIEKSDDL